MVFQSWEAPCKYKDSIGEQRSKEGLGICQERLVPAVVPGSLLPRLEV